MERSKNRKLTIALISMPMVNLQYPSLALTQLKDVIGKRFHEKVSCRVYYMYHDFAVYLGKELYDFLLYELNSGIGEWFFSQMAFPEKRDNTDEYFDCYYGRHGGESKRLKTSLLEKRKNLRYVFDGLIEHYRLLDADIVGFSSLFFQNVSSLAMARRIKQRKKDVTTIMGGANVEYPMGFALLQNTDYIDYIFSGPALKSFPEFIQSRLQGSMQACDEIKGVWSKQNVDRYLENSNLHYGDKLDINYHIDLDYDDFLCSFERYFSNTGMLPYLFFNTSEGCHWGEKTPCSFCAQGGPSGNNMKFSCKTPENAIETIESLTKYKNRVELLYTTDSIVPKHYYKEVFAKLHSEIPVHLEMNVHDVDEQQIRLLAKSGVTVTEAGIESISTRSLRLMRKGTTASRNFQFMMNCMMNGIYVIWNFLVGIPGENSDIYEKMVQDIPSLVHFPPGALTAVTFERFSEYHKNADQYGLQLVPHQFYRFTYPFPREIISQIASNFMDRSQLDYKKGLRLWLHQLIDRCNSWRARWEKNHGDFPVLCFSRENQQHVVIDSRFGKERTIPISQVNYDILQALKNPKKEAQLRAIFPDVDISPEIETLKRNKFIFCDEEYFLNIVFPEKPSKLSFLDR